MRTLIHRRRGAARLLAVLALAAVTTATAAACSSSTTTTASPLNSTSPLAQDCTTVGDALSDGPDPGSDAVGYAQAQVLPLKALKLNESSVRTAVDRLDAAFGAVVDATTASAQSKAAAQVTSAENAVNALCPGATQ